MIFTSFTISIKSHQITFEILAKSKLRIGQLLILHRRSYIHSMIIRNGLGHSVNDSNVKAKRYFSAKLVTRGNNCYVSILQIYWLHVNVVLLPKKVLLALP